MPWGRVDDSLYDHPKLDSMPGSSEWPDRLAAVGLNYIAVSWCNRHLTDGVIPRDRIAKLGGSIELADLLVKAGLWDRGRGGSYLIHDFLVYNDSKAQVVARRERETARKAAWRARSHAGSPDGTDANVPAGVPASVPLGRARLSRAESRDSSRANPDPNPTRPDPTESSTTHPNPSRQREGRRTSRNGRHPEIRTDYDALLVSDDDETPAEPVKARPFG